MSLGGSTFCPNLDVIFTPQPGCLIPPTTTTWMSFVLGYHLSTLKSKNSVIKIQSLIDCIIYGKTLMHILPCIYSTAKNRNYSTYSIKVFGHVSSGMVSSLKKLALKGLCQISENVFINNRI